LGSSYKYFARSLWLLPRACYSGICYNGGDDPEHVPRWETESDGEIQRKNESANKYLQCRHLPNTVLAMKRVEQRNSPVVWACGFHDLAAVCMFIELYEARTAYAGLIFLVKLSDCANVRGVNHSIGSLIWCLVRYTATADKNSDFCLLILPTTRGVAYFTRS